MEYKKINTDWNAEPNAPDVKLTVDNTTVKLDFYLNCFNFDRFKADEKGTLVFNKVHKFSFNSMNDEGYFMGKYRYKQTELPWGEFYQLDTDWQNDFHENVIILLPNADNENLKHFIFFLRDNTFECVAESFQFISGHFENNIS